MDRYASLRQLIASTYKLHGLSLRSDGITYLTEVLSQVESSQREDALEKLVDATLKLPLATSAIDRALCEKVVRDCNEDLSGDNVENTFNVIDAFSVPKFVYNSERKKYLPASQKSLFPVFGDASSKAEVFRARYTGLHQRAMRHELFTPPPLGSAPEVYASKKFQLKTVEYLLSSTAKLSEIIVLGMLTPLKEGKWFLEDPTGAVEVDLKGCGFHGGLFTDGCFVLAEGQYEDYVFHLKACGFLPAEPASVTRSIFGNANFFGGPLTTCAKASEKLALVEQSQLDAMMVFVSDVWLDSARVMDKLRILFQGYSDQPPFAFVFCGPFLSQPSGSAAARTLRDCLKQLADVIQQYPPLASASKFVFVPSPSDPGVATILPRPRIPDALTGDFVRAVPGAVFASNPCRLQYCTREIVVLREDIVTKMCRNCVRFPADGDVPKHFAKAITSQCHLTPLPLPVCPVYWPWDHALSIYPLPDLVVCADKFDPFTVKSSDCTVMNPGSFPRTDFCFKVYYPSTGQVEDSQISV